MISLPHPVRVFLHTPATDLRKGFDALSGLVTTAFAQNPTSGHLFLFVNRRRGRIKIFCLHQSHGRLIRSNVTTRWANSHSRLKIFGPHSKKPRSCTTKPLVSGQTSWRDPPVSTAV
jgi:IS66 Orf2 like protein